MPTTICKYCRSDKLVKRHNGPHIGIYCATCGKWQQWVKQNSPKEREVPWDLLGGKHQIYLPEATILDDLKTVDFMKELPPEAIERIVKNSKLKERFTETDIVTINSLYGKFPSPQKLDEDDEKPPWED